MKVDVANLKRKLSLLLIAAIIFAFVPQINGSFRADAAAKTVTRVEVQRAITDMFGMKYKAKTDYFSVGKDKKGSVSQQEAAKIMCEILDLKPAAKTTKTVKDKSKISKTYRGYVYALLNEGYLTTTKGKVNPKASLTKTQFQKLLKETAGTKIGSNKKQKTYKNNAIIAKKGVTLKNTTIKGNLIIAEGVGSGSITLDGVKVGGKIIVRGGGEKGIRIKGKSKISEIVIGKAKNGIGVSAEKQASIGQIRITKAGGSVSFTGKADTLIVEAKSDVNLKQADVKELVTAAEASIHVDKASKVEAAMIFADNTTIKGEGKVAEVTVAAENAKIDTPQALIKVSDQIQQVTARDDAKIETVKDSEIKKPETIISWGNSAADGIIVDVDIVDEDKTKDEIEEAVKDKLESEKPEVYVAVDAFILGDSQQQFIVAPMKYKAKTKDVTVSAIIENILAEKGYATNATRGSEYYLRSIGGIGSSMAPASVAVGDLPACLKNVNAVSQSGSLINSTPGTLGEFCYTQTSGWMYAVNGVYPNVGMGQYYVEDGDVIRLSFTLYGYGADIGGGYAGGGQGSTDFYSYNYLTDEIKQCVDGTLPIGNLVAMAKKITP